MIITRSSDRNSLKFWSDFDYFHDHKCHKLWNQYDIYVYSVENFVQCVFLPDEFKIKEEIDFRRIYLEKYYNPFLLKQSAFYEMYRYWKLYKPEKDFDKKHLSRRDYMSKHLFHGLRYLDFAEQLIQTNYFEFHYNIPLEKDRKGEKFKKLANTCRSKYRFNSENFDLLRIQFKQN